MNKGRISTQFLLYFLIMMFLIVIGCSRAGGGTAAPAASATAFSQADLTGTWNFTGFQTGSNPGWDRGTIVINSSGDLNFVTYENTHGYSTPADGAIILTINSMGIVTESGTGAASESHCSMSTDKNTVVCVETNGTQYGNRILVKTTGVTFSNADLTGPLSWYLHGISSGGSSAADRGWLYEAGTINSSLQVIVTDSQNPAGPQSLPYENSTFSVGLNGFVTVFPSEGNSLEGMLSSDKKMLIITTRDGASPERYGLSILTIADETFTGLADLVGEWRISTLTGGNDFSWAWISATINSSGVVSMTSFLNSEGSTTLQQNSTVAMTSSGILTESGYPTFNGVLSHDRVIAFATDSVGNYEFDIWIR
jgi:hypothetical protein